MLMMRSAVGDVVMVVLFAFALALTGCAASNGATAPGPSPLSETVLLDVDLTKGDAGPGEVSGGAWERGWRVTHESGDRIVFDAGHPIRAGYLDVSFTMKGRPFDAKARKIDWVGLYQDASLNQAVSAGDIFYARAGDEKYKFSRVKAGGRKFDDTEWEKSVGSTSDWKTDDTAVQTVRLEWRDGVAVFHDVSGREHACSRKLCDAKHPIDALRYAVIGSDKYTNFSLVGVRFVRVKLVEYTAARLGS